MTDAIFGAASGGDWLSRSRIRLLACGFLAVELALFAFLIAGTHGWIVPLETPTTTDFVSFYAAGSLADSGAPQLAYDHAAHLAAEEAATAPGIEYQFFNYPPVFLLLCAVLAPLPYLIGFVGFELLSLALYLFAARRILADATGTALLALLAFPIVLWNFGLGQNAFLTAGLFGLGTLLVDRRPVLAGLCFGALCYKPHLGLLIPLALAAGGRWKSFAAAAAAAAALVLASIAVFGWPAWQAFFGTAGSSHTMYESGRILFSGFASPFGAVRLLGGSVALGYSVQLVAAVGAGVAVALAWRRNLPLPTRAAVLVAGTLLASPVSLMYDLMLPAVAVCWLLRDGAEQRLTRYEKILLAGLFLLLLDPRRLAETLHWPVSPLAAVAVFALALRRMRLEMQVAASPSLAAQKL